MRLVKQNVFDQKSYPSHVVYINTDTHMIVDLVTKMIRDRYIFREAQHCNVTCNVTLVHC